MGRNLGPLNIKDSYEGLVQISGSQLTDGSGSLISNLEVTASYATTADTSISASYAQTSTSASHALIADVALNVPATASYALYAEVAGFATSSLSASYALTSTSASYANNSDSSLTAISASYAVTASYSENAANLNLQQVLLNGNTATGSIELRGINLNDNIFRVYGVDSLGGSSVIAEFGSNIAGAGDRDIFRFIDATTSGALFRIEAQRGTAKIDSTNTGLEIEANGDIVLNPEYIGANAGKIVIQAPTTSSYGIQADGGFTGSLQGNADTATSASHALISDFAHSATSASFATTALLATSASHALVSDLATTASYVENAVSASYAVSSSHSDISDFAFTATSASYATTATLALSASHANNSDTATSSSHAVSSDSSLTSISASHAVISDTSISSSYSTFSETSVSSSHAVNSDTAISSSYATTATSASYALTASFAENAGASTLEEVLTAGNTATNNIILTGSAEISGSLRVIGNAIIGDSVSSITAGTYIAVAGGDEHRVGTVGTPNGSGIFAGHYNLVNGQWNGILAGSDNQIANNAERGVIVGGWENLLNGSNASAIVGGGVNAMNANYAGMIGGESNTINQGYSAIIAGATNVVNHQYSVILGGSNITSTKDNEVTVPHLTISGSVTAGVYTLTDVAGTTTMDCSLGNFFTLTMPAGGSTTLTPSNIQAGQTINVKITQNATPSTIAFDASVDFEGGTAFAVSTGAGEVDVMTFISFDGTSLQATGLKNFS
jgi:hypothetical protein